MDRFKNRHGEFVEVEFPYPLGPVAGKCARCGATLGAYWSKRVDRNTGEMYCENRECGNWAQVMFLIEHGFHHYSDG